MNNSSEKIIFLRPVCTHAIWGGSRLREEFGYKELGEDIGECWGISAHKNGDGTIACGPFAGHHLSWLWKNHGELFGRGKIAENEPENEEEFPLLVKILDAKDDLSIQVHPDDEYAARNEDGQLGKTECWYILDCPADGKLVIGHNAKTKNELDDMIDEKRWGDLIRTIPVKKGDLIQIDPGTVHAIKAGFVILETQQSSDITYRVYDYDRKLQGKKRQLHVRESKEVINIPAKKVEDSIISLPKEYPNFLNKLYEGKYYKIFHMKVEGDAYIQQKYDFLNVTVTEGEGEIDGEPISKGDNFILPFNYGKANLCGHMELVASTI